MKTLKELKEKCTLLMEHKQPAFIGKETDQCYYFNDSNTCKLFTDNKGNFYLYKKIGSINIIEYDNYNTALERYISFIYNTCNK